MEGAFASRYRLGSLVRPDLDPGAFLASELSDGATHLACLVSRPLAALTRERAGPRFDALPGVVPIIDVFSLADDGCPSVPGGDPRGEAVVVLELVAGMTLEELVRAGGNDPASAVSVLLGVADALAGLHALGGFHGGVTPLAITVADDGTAHLGLAGVQDSAIGYQSPARLCDEDMSAADDAWALLACLYFAVTKSPPFHGENAGALARRVLGGRPAAIRATTDAEKDLQSLFDRGFSRTPSRRYETVDALAADLRAWRVLHAPPTEPVPTRTTTSDLVELSLSSGPPRAPSGLIHPVIEIVASTPGDSTMAQSPAPSRAADPHPIAEAEPAVPPPVVAETTPPRESTRSAASTAPSSLERDPRPAAAPSHAGRAPMWLGGLVALAAVGAGVWRLMPGGEAPDAGAAPATGAPAVPAPRPAIIASASARASGAATATPAPDLDACVAAWFPPDSLDPDTDLSFLCAEHEGRAAASKVRKALLAGGRGKHITDAMKEWQRFGWFEIPVVATLRASCCPGAPPLELPHVPGSSCAPPRGAVQALGAATASHGDVAATVKAYRKLVSCLVDVGDVPAYGQTGGIGAAEEPAFRAFAARGK